MTTDLTSEPADVSISVQNLSKLYKVYRKPADVLWEAFGNRKLHLEEWAVKDVSFDVHVGEVVGIIGANGAGKSTVLKMIAGTLDATAGRVKTRGKISAILELGTGFNPEYTGRQNILMGGLCMGMSKQQIVKKTPWIIDFSGLKDVIDRPFKTYSSGMQARLTFSVAISVDPEVFIVDEALAAGDALFVHKCMKRIREICESGATVLFVSHSDALIAELCDRAIWLDHGQIRMIGQAGVVAKAYARHVWTVEAEQTAAENARLAANAAQPVVTAESLEVLPEPGATDAAPASPATLELVPPGVAPQPPFAAEAEASSLAAEKHIVNELLWLDKQPQGHAGAPATDAAAFQAETSLTIDKPVPLTPIEPASEGTEREHASALERVNVSPLQPLLPAYTLGGETIKLVSVRTLDANGQPVALFETGDELNIEIVWEGRTHWEDCYCSFRIDGARLNAVAGCEGYDIKAFINDGKPLSGRGRVVYTIKNLALGHGTYFVSASICRHMVPKSKEGILHYLDQICAFTVKRKSLWVFTYLYDPPIEWKSEHLASSKAYGT